ncbi:FAD-dependent monooxygenase [Myxococcaceae bacterium GXIMD 01537]
MRILIIGGGPAGLFFSLLHQRAHPTHTVTVVERAPEGASGGSGVVLSDEALSQLLAVAPEVHARLVEAAERWDALDVHVKGEVQRCGGHGFLGVSRQALLRVLREQAVGAGVRLVEGREVEVLPDLAEYDLVVGADGARSRVRALGAERFRTSLESHRCRYLWLGTSRRFDSFQFLFEETPHGLIQAHAYRFAPDRSAFIVECDEATWRGARFDTLPVEEAVAGLERVFARHLDGHSLLAERATWQQFVTVRNEVWHHGNVVLLGDAAHTAHFSIGSGTKLALEDAAALAEALRAGGAVPEALGAYEAARRPLVERAQRAAGESLRWFENVRRYWHLEPWQFTLSLLTRSLRLGWDSLEARDGALVERARKAFAGGREPAPPPMFTPFRLRGLTLPNRVVMAPMCMYSAVDGLVDDFHLVHLGSRALGGTGLLIAEKTAVSPEGRITPGCAGLYRDGHTAAWKRVVDFVHARSPAKVGVQLGHAGRKASVEVPWRGDNRPVPVEAGGWPVLGPSPIPYASHMPTPAAMSREDMLRVRDDYLVATRRALEAGFDLVELHMAHGYLLASFLSPLSNRREDAYGGSLENRLRFPLEVLDAVRAAWPEERPVSVRISATDWVEGGMEGEDAVRVARALKAHGCDVVHVSTGATVPGARIPYGRLYQVRFSDQIRHEAGVPTIAVGAISRGEEANAILAAGRADLVALAREHLRDPHWTQHEAVRQGWGEHFWPAPYGSVRPKRM